MKLKITVHGVAYEVDVEVLDPEEGFPSPRPLPVSRPGPPTPASPTPSPATTAPPTGKASGSIVSPIAGAVLEIPCRTGDNIQPGQNLVIIEAMKMKTAVPSPVAGRIKAIPIAVGDNVREGQVLVELE